MKEHLRPQGWQEPAVYSQGIKAGNLIFLAGQTSVDDEGKVVGVGNIRVQSKQVYERIKRLLEEAGAGFEDVVKLTTYLTDIKSNSVVREARMEYFKGHKAPSTVVSLTKVEVIALKDR